VKGMTGLSVNGTPIPNPQIVNGYAVITRDWNAGDKVEFTLPLAPQRVHAHEQVAADRGMVALRYGPMIYNIESADNQDVNGILAPGTPLTAEWRGDMLQGVTVIKGTFADGMPMLAIPNYARNNRGGRSQVWIREQ